MSQDTASCMPASTCSSAQSSPTPRTARLAGRVKWRAMSSNSPATRHPREPRSPQSLRRTRRHGRRRRSPAAGQPAGVQQPGQRVAHDHFVVRLGTTGMPAKVQVQFCHRAGASRRDQEPEVSPVSATCDAACLRMHANTPPTIRARSRHAASGAARGPHHATSEQISAARVAAEQKAAELKQQRWSTTSSRPPASSRCNPPSR